jgi:hypothetical protein
MLLPAALRHFAPQKQGRARQGFFLLPKGQPFSNAFLTNPSWAKR